MFQTEYEPDDGARLRLATFLQRQLFDLVFRMLSIIVKRIMGVTKRNDHLDALAPREQFVSFSLSILMPPMPAAPTSMSPGSHNAQAFRALSLDRQGLEPP